MTQAQVQDRMRWIQYWRSWELTHWRELEAIDSRHQPGDCEFTDAVKTDAMYRNRWYSLTESVGANMRSEPSWTDVAHMIGEKLRGRILTGGYLIEENETSGEIG